LGQGARVRGKRDAGRGTREEGRGTRDGRRKRDAGRKTKDERRRTKDEGRRTKDEGRRTSILHRPSLFSVLRFSDRCWVYTSGSCMSLNLRAGEMRNCDEQLHAPVEPGALYAGQRRLYVLLPAPVSSATHGAAVRAAAGQTRYPAMGRLSYNQSPSACDVPPFRRGHARCCAPCPRLRGL
jgi:hypothetical protein